MRRLSSCFVAFTLLAAGCGDDQGSDSGTGGTTGDLEWPPDATAYFDEYDILNADCATDEDCAMVLGYYHAKERFVQMDIRRRFSTGRLADILPKGLAELLDVPGVAADTRALFSTREGQPGEEFLLEQASPKTRALLEAYSAGVNQWIEEARSGDAPFPRELSNPPLDYGPDRVPEWTPEDSIATVLALVENLTNDEGSQVDAGLARAAINDDNKFSDLWSRRPLKESSILAPGWQPPAPQAALAPKRAAPNARWRPALRERFLPALEKLRSKLAASRELRHLLFGSGQLGVEVGSNNWVVAPERTVDGNALLSNDPHLGMSQPATWYLAHLDGTTNGSGEIHTAGTTFAGLPWVIVGQNESIAWGLTTTVFDFSDVYVEELVTDGGGSPTGVMFQGREVPFTRVSFPVSFNDGSTEERELLFVPHHGAVREIDVDNGTAVTLRWTGNDTDTDINFLTELATATNVAEARVALENITTIGQNVVVIDLEGNIGWFPYNRLPRRTWATNLDGPAPPWLPLDGRGDYEWTAAPFFGLEELPQAFNPAEGYIATANNDMTGALFDGDPTNDFDAPYQVEAAAGFRHAQIVELIESFGAEHTTDTMDAIVSDVYSLIGQEMTPGILAIANDAQTVLTPEAQRVVNALETWNYTCPTGLEGTNADFSPLVTNPAVLREASGCTAFHTALNEIRFQIEENEFAPSFYTPSSRKPSIAVFYSVVNPAELVAGDVYWDNPATVEVEDKFQVMGDALDLVGNFLVSNLGGDETAWAWGRLHGLELESDLSAFGVTQYNNPPPDEPLFANDGGLFTVDVANPDPRDLVQRAGPSTRFVCEALPSGPKCTYQLPGGQSGDIESDFYEDLLVKWLGNEPIDVVFDIDEAATNAVRTVRFD